ncbi:MAG: hypothetical protein BMS9Abin33_0849 [Gammaproteobacteria bacterium]|nr:MAG: hypothetical protein BMS9Abin33_0849 [Gammaproteobacteria bacterium]
MKKLLKYAGYFFAGLVALLLVIVIALNLITDTQYKDWITSATKSATGRDFSIEDLELKVGSTFQIRANNIRMANAEWADQKDMVNVKHLEVEIGLLPLLSGKADIRLVVEKAEVLAEKNADGISNWAMGSDKQKAEEKGVEESDEDESEFSGLPLDPIIREIRIDDFTLTRVMEAGVPAKITHLKQLLIETPEEDTTISLIANANGHPVEMTGNLGNMEKFLYESSEPVNLKADIDGNILNLSGDWGPILPKQTMQVDFDLKIPGTASLAEAVGLELDEFEDINITGKIIGDGKTLSLDPFEINLDDPTAKLRIKGSIADLTSMSGINIATDANTESLGTLLQQLNVELPIPLPPVVEVSAEISGGLKELALSEVVVNIRDEGMDIKATASIGDLLNAQKITGKLTGTIDSLSVLSKYAQMDLPSLGKIQFSGDLASNNKALQLNNLDIKLNSDNIDFAVTGKVEDLLTVSGIDALVKADISSFSKQNITELSALFKQLGTELPVEMLPQSISLNAGVQGSLEQLSLVNIQGEVLDKGVKVGLSGAVGNVLAPSGVDVKLSLDSNSIAALSKYAGSELPDTDPLKVLLALKEDNAKQNNFTVHAETGGVNVEINGALKSLAVPEPLELDISIKAKSLDAFNRLAQKEFPDMGPLEVSGNLQIQKNSFAVNDLKLQLNDESASGNLSLKLPENDKSPTVINGKLDIAYLDLNFLLPEEEEAPAAGDAPAIVETEPAASVKPSVNTDRLFSSEPNLGENLHKYEIDLNVNAKKIKFGKANMRDVEIVVTLKDGLFSADPIKGVGGAGNMNGIIRIDGRSATPELEVDLAILQVPTPNLGGKLDFDMDIVGRGKSVAELMASLNGRILFVMRDGKIEGAMVKKLGSGLLSFSKEKNYTTLECGIIRVDIKDGIADFEKNLAAQLTEVTWRGGGTVNLKTEELDVGITPKPRKGIPISITGSLSGLAVVGGTLKNPKLELDPKDVAVKYAKYSAHVATGGLTLIAEKIKDKIQANQDICEKILDGTVFDEADKEKAKAKEKAEKEKKKQDN